MAEQIPWCTDLPELIDFLAYISVYAPDEFPHEDGDRFDLERAFTELCEGLERAAPEIKDEALVAEARRMIDLAQAEYCQGDIVQGAATLVELQYILRAV